MFDALFPPLAMAECGFCGDLGCIPTTYGTETALRILEWEGRGHGTHQP